MPTIGQIETLLFVVISVFSLLLLQVVPAVGQIETFLLVAISVFSLLLLQVVPAVGQIETLVADGEVRNLFSAESKCQSRPVVK